MRYQPPVGATDANAPYAPRNLASGGTTGSRVPAAAVEQPQREIVNAILADGLTPSDDVTQLAQVIAARAKADLSNLTTGALRLNARINIGSQDIFPEDKGAVDGFGVTTPEALAANSVALRQAFEESVLRGFPVRFSKNRIYRHGALIIPNGSMAVGRGRLQPVVPAGDPSPFDVWIGDDSTFEDLIFEMPAQASSKNQETAIVKNRVQIGGILAIRAWDGTLRDGSICFDGDEWDINDLRSKNIRRPFLVAAQSIRDGVSPIAPRRGWRIKDFRVDTFFRAFRLMGVADYSMPRGKTFGVAAGATKSPGNNCILVGGSKNGSFGVFDFADNQEHCIRGAHAPGYGDSVGNTFADVTSRRSRGCVFKFNDGAMNSLAEDGVGGKAQWRKTTVTKVTGYDVGLGTGAGHGGSALIRASHTRETTFGLATAIAQDTPYACWQLLQTTDNDGFIVESLTGHGLVRRAIDVTTNADWPGPTPDVRSVIIGRLNATLDGVAPAAIRFNLKPKTVPDDADPDEPQTPTPQGKVGDFRVLGGTISGCQYLAVCGTETIGEGGSDDETGDVTPIDGDIYLNVHMHGAGVSGGFYRTPPANARVRLDVLVANGTKTVRYDGRADQYNAVGAAAGVVRCIEASGVAIPFTGSTAATTLKTVTIPGGSLGPNGWARITALWTSSTVNANVKTGRTRVNGNIWSGQALTSGSNARSVVTVQNAGSVSSQVGASGSVNYGSGSGTPQTASINTANDWPVDFNALLAVDTDNLTLAGYTIETCYLP